MIKWNNCCKFNFNFYSYTTLKKGRIYILIKGFPSNLKHLFSILILFVFATSLLSADQVSIVQYPLMNRPVIVEQDGSFLAECKGSSGQNWSATLSLPELGKEYSVTDSKVSYNSQTGVQTLRISIPNNLPIELYDLTINGDIVKNAVKVIDAFKNSYSFVHLPDVHLPSVAWKLDYVDENTKMELRQVLAEINLIAPEFVLQTGDIVNNGENENEFQIAQEILEQSEVPVFITGGNHDLWYDAHQYWYSYFGPVMDYDFLYGDTRYLALEMYDQPNKTYTAKQMEWLRNQLEYSIDANEASRIVFTHFDESRQLTGDFTDEYDVRGILYGHVHKNIEERSGSNSIPKLCTSFTMNDNGHFRLVKVENGEIVDYPVLSYKKLWTNIYPNDNGNSSHTTIEIHNENDVDLEDILVKVALNVNNASITGGTQLQDPIAFGNQKWMYYVLADVNAESVTNIQVGNVPNNPPAADFDPIFPPDMFAGSSQIFEFAVDGATSYSWQKDGNTLSGETQASYNFQPNITFQGETEISVTAITNRGNVSKSWLVNVRKSTNKPVVNLGSTQNFALADEPYTISWFEPVNKGAGRFWYRLASGGVAKYIEEDDNSNSVTFTPENENMALGLYYCRIAVNGVSSQEFAIVVESSQKPQLIHPIGNITSYSPIFQWEPVPGVPYYVLMMLDQKLEINSENDEFELENATPTWALLTAETSVPYGAPDPSGYFTSFPPPLEANKEYSWVVLNCYGPTPELVSTNVVPDIQTLFINLDPPELDKPQLISPADGGVENNGTIRFVWNKVNNAVGYHFYPFKLDTDENLGEVVLPIWETEITTTDTILDYQADQLLTSGEYKWKVAAIDEDGLEMPSDIRQFSYEAPSCIINIRSYSKNAATGNTEILPRVYITAEAVQGVDPGYPLSTDTQGKRDNLIFTPGIYEFHINKDGYAPLDTTLTFVENTETTLQFYVYQDPSKLSGTVEQVIANGSEPLATAIVTIQHSLESHVSRTAQTDQNGNFNVSLIPGPYLISAIKTGYAPSDTLSLSVEPDSAAVLETPVTLTQYKNKIYGYILSKKGSPIYGATVNASRSDKKYTITTDANGRYSFLVSDGTWKIIASKSGFITSDARSIFVSNGAETEVTPSIVLEPATSLVNGTATDGLQVIQGVIIKATPSSGTILTDETDGYGNFSLSAQPGYYQLTGEKKGYSSGKPQEITLQAGQTLSGITVKLTPNASIVSGLVTSDGVLPVVNAEVHVNGEMALTNSSGRYQVEVPAGQYEVTASKEGYLNDKPQSVSVSVGQTVDGINFIISPNASVIKGRIYYDGNPVAGATVISRNGQEIETKTDDNGYYVLNVEAGEDTVSAWKSGFTQSSRAVTVGEAQTIDGINFYLNRYVSYLSGVVYNVTSGQEPLSGATISIEGNGKSTTSGTDGSYQMQVDPSASGYTLLVTKSGFSQDTEDTGALTSEQNKTIDFQIEKYETLIKGDIFDNLGNRLDHVQITVVNSTDAAVSSEEGQFLMGLSQAGQMTVQLSKPGYKDSTFTISVVTGDQLIKTLELQRDFKNIQGKIFDVVKGIDSSSVASAAISLAGQASLSEYNYITTSNADGTYTFLDENGNSLLIAGNYTVQVSKTGYEDTSLVVSIVNDTLNENVGLRKLTGELHGKVLDTHLNPVDSVSVIATHVVSSKRYSRITNANGLFSINAIAAGNYTVQLSLLNYTSDGVRTVTARTDSVYEFTLTKNEGRFQGRVTDAITGDPVSYAYLVVKDAFGNQGKDSATGKGVYSIQNLPTRAPYNMSISGSGYHSTSIKDTSAYTTTTDSTHITLTPVIGTISGSVHLDTLTGDGLQGVLVKLQGDTVQTLITNAQGAYEFDGLGANTYYLSVEKPGFIAQPTLQKVNISASQELVEDLDFVLTEAVIERIEISAQPSLVGSDGGTFSYAAMTGERNQVPIVPTWSVSLQNAISDSILTNDGKDLFLEFDSTFVGSIWIFVEDTVSDFRDSVQVKIVESLDPADPARIFRDFKGGEFHFPGNAVANAVLFGLDHKNVPNIKKTSRIDSDLHRVLGEIYDLNFNPADEELLQSMQLILPVPEGVQGDVVICRWNEKTLKWQLIGGTVADGKISVQLDSLSQYAVLEQALPLGVREFSALPNPFSPYAKPMTLSFEVSSQESDMILVSIHIYNIVGDLVRTLMDDNTYNSGDIISAMWDGMTDYQRMAKNGRYLVHIKINDGAGDKDLLKPIVLIK